MSPPCSKLIWSPPPDGEMRLKLKRPPYPTVVGTAVYFFTHAGHRETAIDHAIQVIRDDAARATVGADDDPIMAALQEPIGPWVIESLNPGRMDARVPRMGKGDEELRRGSA